MSDAFEWTSPFEGFAQFRLDGRLIASVAVHPGDRLTLTTENRTARTEERITWELPPCADCNHPLTSNERCPTCVKARVQAGHSGARS